MFRSLKSGTGTMTTRLGNGAWLPLAEGLVPYQGGKGGAMEMTNNEITSTSEMAENEWDGYSEPSDVQTDMVATKGAEGKGIEFHVSMRDHTMHDMEALIVEAAATMLVGRHRDSQMAKTIEQRAIAMITEQADAVLAGVTKEIIEQPLIPAFGDKKPVTMREFIGLTGREYLTERVDRDGKKSTSSWGDTTYTRIELAVSKYMDRAFKKEIEAATNAAITEIRKAIQADHTKFLEAEKARVRDALAKATA